MILRHEIEFKESRPSRKNKYAARVGHPELVETQTVRDLEAKG